MKMTVAPPPGDDEGEPVKVEEVKKVIPPYGTREWLDYCYELDGHLPTPINVSITGSIRYTCPELRWYNFDVYPHKVKITNTGYTVLLGAKWKAERPFLEGGPFLERYILSQVHFHWGSNMMEGSEHAVDERRYPGEMQVTFFKSEYMTQEEAINFPDGIVMFCYLIKYGVVPDERLSWVLEGFPRIREAQTHTRVGPYPMSRLLPMFKEDYFMYWGRLEKICGDSYPIRWIVPRITISASMDQMKDFRKLGDPWDEPNLGNFRPLQEKQDRSVFFIDAHWCQYNSLLPLEGGLEPAVTVLSPCYQNNYLLLPPQNAYMIPKPEEEEETHHEYTKGRDSNS